MSEPEIILTQSAAKRVAWIAERQHKAAILRLAVDGGGCAGFTYKFELADGAEDGDAIAETDGVTLVVDPVSLELVKGSAVDFVEDLAGAAFRSPTPTPSRAAAADRASRSSPHSLGRATMKLATYNLNGIRARLPRLLEWLAREQPDVACLQELKCADESLPIADIEARRLRRCVARAEGLQRSRDPGQGRFARAAPSGAARRPRR